MIIEIEVVFSKKVKNIEDKAAFNLAVVLPASY